MRTPHSSLGRATIRLREKLVVKLTNRVNSKAMQTLKKEQMVSLVEGRVGTR
jgi:hypothetical protein